MNFKLLFVLLSVTFVCCYAQDSFTNSSCSCNDSFSVATFNTEQITFSDFRDQRLNATINYFLNPPIDLDLICFQETWDPSRRDRLITGLASRFPFNYSAPQQPQICQGESACRSNDPVQLEQCINEFSCARGTNSEFNDFLRCFRDKCNDIFDTFPDRCKACLLIELGDIPDFGQCDPLNEMLAGECLYLFQGWPDPLLVSKLPFIETGFLPYTNSPLVVWAAIYGKIAISPTKNLTVFCTHLSAEVPVFTGPADIEQANRDQSAELVDYVRRIAGPDDAVLVMGDMNNGPTTGSITANFPEGYAVFQNAGWNDLILTIPNPPCTYCKDNPLHGEGEPDKDQIRDHIFLTGNFTGSCVQNVRIIASGNIVDAGNGQMVPLSDHRGLSASFCNLFANTTTANSTGST